MIESVGAREIIDSRGNPTVEVEIVTEHGLFRASVPSGASVGSHEAIELRDGDQRRYHGKGVLNAIHNVTGVIADKIRGLDSRDQARIDQQLHELDRTLDFSQLGSNATLGVSLAAAKAGAAAEGTPLFQHIARLAGKSKISLPIPAFNVINGGVHAPNLLPFQEFMIVPIGMDSFHEALRAGCEIYHELKCILAGKYGMGACCVGDEGGFAPPTGNVIECCDLIVEAIEAAGYDTNRVKISIDIAASEFHTTANDKYNLEFKNPHIDVGKGSHLRGSDLLDYYRDYLMNGPRSDLFLSLEDPFHQDDWKHFSDLTTTLNSAAVPGRSPILVIGDDLLATNVGRITEAADKRSCTGLLLKPNQCGTLTDTIHAALAAEHYGMKIMASHRSGETEDTSIADIAVGLSTSFIKAGAPCRSERLAKYNQLLRIEDHLEGKSCDGCGSLHCRCDRSSCTCLPKTEDAHANYGKRYLLSCGPP